MAYYCWTEGENINIKIIVSLDRIRQNLIDIKQSTSSKLILMLKADAYGHGLERVAKATCDIVDGFGVVSLEEGLAARRACHKIPVFVNCLSVDEIQTAVQNDLTIGLSNRLQLERLCNLYGCNIGGKVPDIHLKVDTGMHRLGFDASEVEDVCKRLKKSGLELSGVYSHFGNHPDLQAEKFENACNTVRRYFPTAIRHIASSHTFLDVRYAYDAVRIGLKAYEGAMRVESQVVASRSVACGEYLGYGNEKTADATNIAVVFGGYADGIDRERFPFVEARSRRFKVVGVCMDTLLIDTKEERLKEGEKVVLCYSKTVDELAKNINTIPYVLMTAWKGRIDKIYC